VSSNWHTPTFPFYLYAYQHQGAAFLAGKRYAYLADEMGLGKTVQAILAAKAAGAQRILVVPPASLKINWLREFAWCWDGPAVMPRPGDKIPSGNLLAVVNYDVMHRPELLPELRRQRWDLVIADEAHALMTPTAIRTRAVLGARNGILKYASALWLLSATPMLKHLGDLYPTLAAICPDAVEDLPYEDWLHKHCYVKQTPYGPCVMGNRPGAVSTLKPHLDTFLLRRRLKEIFPGITPPLFHDLLVDNEQALAAIERAAQDHAWKDVEAVLDDEYAEDDPLATMRRLIGEAKAAAMLPILQDELSSTGEKQIIMCWHQSVADLLYEGLKSFKPVKLTGKTHHNDRQKAVDSFQNDRYCRVFIGQIKAAGAGLTLSASRRMTLIERSWSPWENAQAVHRLRYHQQAGRCDVRFVGLAGSVDAAVVGVNMRKTQNTLEILE
jgi:SWI/SNF-related matrix-associated actin-dependent regulator of chromatin subfamily A-like protein 1